MTTSPVPPQLEVLASFMGWCERRLRHGWIPGITLGKTEGKPSSGQGQRCLMDLVWTAGRDHWHHAESRLLLADRGPRWGTIGSGRGGREMGEASYWFIQSRRNTDARPTKDPHEHGSPSSLIPIASQTVMPPGCNQAAAFPSDVRVAEALALQRR